MQIFSSNWHRVAGLRPQLSASIRVHRHRYRGQSWYVLEDRASGRSHRFTPAAWLLLSALDGRRTVETAWQMAIERLGDDAPTQDEVIQLLGQLHGVDALQSEVVPDVDELAERRSRLVSSRRQSLWRNPLSIRLPLWDPDRFLTRTEPWVEPFIGPAGRLFWLLLVGWAGFLGLRHWNELTLNLGDRLLSGSNLLLMALVFPVVKLIHELGHGWVTRSRGAEVHELGVMFLVFMPLPYVDSSGANAFRSKWDRAFVGAAGMYFETALAALALIGWTLVEPGIVRALLFNVVLVAGLSTLLFNLNPLLKFDGYYILSDLLEIPNLATRSARLWKWGLQRHLLRVPAPAPFRLDAGEGPWLWAYTPLSWAYRLSLMVSIALFLATEYFFVGVVLALWSVTQSVVLPLGKGLAHVLTGSALQAHRARAVGMTVAAVGGLAVLLFAVPLPSRLATEGVVWVPDDAQVRVQTAGFVAEPLAPDGEWVEPGQALLQLRMPPLEARAETLQARVAELGAKLGAERFVARHEAELTQRALQTAEDALATTQGEVSRLTVSSPSAGRLMLDQPEDLPGRYLKRGTVVGHVLRGDHHVVRVVIRQDDIGLLRSGVRSVEVRVAPRLGDSLKATVAREIPAARGELPSRTLATAGGGMVPVDPADASGMRTLERLLHLELEVAEGLSSVALGSRAYVRFDLESEPAAGQVWRRVRQLFLSRFDL